MLQTRDATRAAPLAVPSATTHIRALDGLRGVAVLGVMATHLLAGNLSRLPASASYAVGLGVVGVDIFFVLSGFLITGILRDSLNDPAFFRNFYARRVLRIFPLYYGVLAVLLVLGIALHVQWNGLGWSLLLYLQNTRLVSPSLVEFHNRFFSVDHLWSLAVEEQFYLVWPLIVAGVRSGRKLLMVCATGIVGSLMLRIVCLGAGFGFDWVNRNTLCRSDELLAGAALALVLRSRYRDQALSHAAPILLGGLAAAALQRLAGFWMAGGVSASRSAPVLTSLNYTWTMLMAAGLILTCLRPRSQVRAMFESAWLRWFGRYSYGLYVLHLLLLPAATLLLLDPLRQVTGSRVLPRLLIGAVVFAASCALAYSSFHLYEKRFIGLKRYFLYAPPTAATYAFDPSAVNKKVPILSVETAS